MSARRIITGVVIGCILLAAGAHAVWYWEVPAQYLPIALLIVVATCAGFLAHVHRSWALRPYWQRGCMGIRWRRRFPDSSKREIREFLGIFIDSFFLRQTLRSRLSPEDRVLDLYRALYPPGDGLGDAFELETLASNLDQQYRMDLHAFWREDITLGEVYEHTRSGTAQGGH